MSSRINSVAGRRGKASEVAKVIWLAPRVSRITLASSGRLYLRSNQLLEVAGVLVVEHGGEDLRRDSRSEPRSDECGLSDVAVDLIDKYGEESSAHGAIRWPRGLCGKTSSSVD